MLSGVLPVLVVYLSEIVSSDVQYSVKVAEKERKAVERRRRREVSSTEAGGGLVYSIEQARAARAEQRAFSKVEVLNKMLDIWRVRPDISMAELAREVGRSRTTVYNYLDELAEKGLVVNTSDGVRVVDGNGHKGTAGNGRIFDSTRG